MRELLVTPNFDQVVDKVEEGIYRVRVKDSKLGTWEGKDGKPSTSYVAWTLVTFDEADSKNNGRHVFHNTPIEGKGAFRLKDFFKAAMHEECVGSFDPSMLYGHELEITIGTQKNNPDYTEVKS